MTTDRHTYTHTYIHTHTHTGGCSFYLALLLEGFENGDLCLCPERSVDHEDAIQVKRIAILEGGKGGGVLGERQGRREAREEGC